MAGDLRKCSFIKLEAHQGRVSGPSVGGEGGFTDVRDSRACLFFQVITCGWSSRKGLLATSGSDGTVRVWNVTKNQYTLQQTCIFNKE